LRWPAESHIDCDASTAARVSRADLPGLGCTSRMAGMHWRRADAYQYDRTMPSVGTGTRNGTDTVKLYSRGAARGLRPGRDAIRGRTRGDGGLPQDRRDDSGAPASPPHLPAYPVHHLVNRWCRIRLTDRCCVGGAVVDAGRTGAMEQRVAGRGRRRGYAGETGLQGRSPDQPRGPRVRSRACLGSGVALGAATEVGHCRPNHGKCGCPVVVNKTNASRAWVEQAADD
jgi:hypothetical protein